MPVEPVLGGLARVDQRPRKWPRPRHERCACPLCVAITITGVVGRRGGAEATVDLCARSPVSERAAERGDPKTLSGSHLVNTGSTPGLSGCILSFILSGHKNTQIKGVEQPSGGGCSPPKNPPSTVDSSLRHPPQSSLIPAEPT